MWGSGGYRRWKFNAMAGAGRVAGRLEVVPTPAARQDMALPPFPRRDVLGQGKQRPVLARVTPGGAGGVRSDAVARSSGEMVARGSSREQRREPYKPGVNFCKQFVVGP